MIEVAVYNRVGEEIEKLKVDEKTFGSVVRYPLLKQAIVMYNASKRVGTAATKSRGMIAGSTKKLFKQKGTGNARVGPKRTGKRIGGGVTFGKYARDFSNDMPKKQRRLARDSAVLAKLLTNKVVVVENLVFDQPKTKEFAGVLNNLKIDRSCLVAINGADTNFYKSARNIPRVAVTLVAELNAGEVCNHQKLLFTKDAFLSLVNKSTGGENN